MQGQRKQSLASRSTTQATGSTQIQNNDLKSQMRNRFRNQVQGSMEEQATKKQKTTPKCPSMPLDEYIKMNEQQLEPEELEYEDGEENEKDKKLRVISIMKMMMMRKLIIIIQLKKKYIILEKGRKAVYAIINDAWRRYKCLIKKNHFSKYKNLRERQKNRPDIIPEAHFRELMNYWRLEVVQRASKEDRELPIQAEMFIETRQSKKGKRLDEETNNAIIKLQDLTENSGQPSTEAFQTMFGKEKLGRVRCYGRTTTPTLLKKNKEIAEIEKIHANEVKHLNDKVQGMEAEHAEMKAKHVEMEQKFQLLLRTMINQSNSGMNVEALVALLLTPGDANSVLCSSTSTHAPNNHELNVDEMDEDQLLDNLEDVEYEDVP
ncbi:putative transposase, Ptta/En/Spm, plant [Sesbania bispinosa]|nr:putative transposase, Ptta/En/Spm, plant [Sesbania bispinosa]